MAQTLSSERPGKCHQFICIEYPGIVNDVAFAIETLGGKEKMSEVHCEQNRRMELRFRPDDAFCKPACGERQNTTALLIKVTRMRKKKRSASGSKIGGTHSEIGAQPSNIENIAQLPEIKDTEVLGIVHTTYTFTSTCEFQFLPLVGNEAGEMTGVYNSLVPCGMESSNWLNLPAPLFLPPAAFSRMDIPQDYRFRKDTNRESKIELPQNIISGTRHRRMHFTIFQSYRDLDIPTNPNPGSMSQIRFKFLDKKLYYVLREHFDKRPLWSKNALKVVTGFSKDTLKILLPTVAYYFNNGPWRNLWVKFGYDPRKEPNSWIYQTFDFRIRQSGGLKTKVEAKRGYANYILPYKSTSSSKRKTSVIQSSHFGETGDEEGAAAGSSSTAEEGKDEVLYILRPGMVPPHRQMFYQYCDIHIPEVQKILEEGILSDANRECNERFGWLPVGLETKCRDLVAGLVEKAIGERDDKSQELQDDKMQSTSENSDDSQMDGNSTDDDALE